MGRLSRFFPTASIGAYLVAMAILATLPLLGFVIFLLWQLERSEYEALRQEAAQDAQTIGRNFERKLADMETTLRLLAGAAELNAGDLKAFHQRTASSLGTGSLYVLLVDKEGNQKLNTRVPFGVPLQRMTDLKTLNAVLAFGNIEASGIFFGATSRQWVFNVVKPLSPRLSASGAALVLTQNAGDLVSLTSTDILPPAWSAAVIDVDNKVIVSSGSDNIPSGDQFPEHLVKLMVGSNQSAVTDHGGQETMLGYARVGDWPWRVAVWGPVSTAQASLASTWQSLIYGSLALLAVSLGIVLVAAQQLRRSIRQIANMAGRIGQGEIVSPEMTKVTEANQVAIALSNASFDRAQSEERIHFILQELVHRTKNILSLVQAMLRQLARGTDSVDELQKAVSGRLSGLAQSIEALAKQQWGGIPLSTVIELQLSAVVGSMSRIETRGEDLLANANAVQNLGLIFYELATNSVKYGALSVAEGRVLIEWVVIDGEDGARNLQLRWIEAGGPPVVKPSRQGFGTTVIERHAASAFGGRVVIDFEDTGLRWTLSAPLSAIENPQAHGEH